MEIGDVFRDELKEELSRLELILLNLEKKGEAAPLKDQAKRILHNMKGSARVAGFEACARVIHHLETLLLEKPLPSILEFLLCGMDLCLSLVEPNADPNEAERFITGPLPTRPIKKTEPHCAPVPCEPTEKKSRLLLPATVRVLVCGDPTHLRSHQSYLNDQDLLLQWRDNTRDIAILLQEEIFDAVVLDFSCLNLAHGCVIRRIRRVSESIPIILLAENLAPCLLLQISRLDNVSCFMRPLLHPESLIFHLQKRIVMARQSLMFSRALRTIWYLDPQQDTLVEKDARTLMHYQDRLRAASSSHQEWDFESHSQKDKHLVLFDVHDEIDVVLQDLMQRIDQKTLPLSLVRLRHRHLLDCIHQHFLEENAMMRVPDHSKKFLEQHVRHHDEAMQEFHSQRVKQDVDDIRFFCDRVTQFIRQHASFDQTLEDYLLRDVA